MLKSKKVKPDAVGTKGKKMKKQYKMLIGTLIILICLGGISFSVYRFLSWHSDNNSIKKLEDDLQKSVKVEVIPPHEEDPDATTMENPPEDKGDIYWQYKDVPLIDVDIHALKEENPDTVGWIQVPGTSINYPVVQTTNNDYYLTHDFKKRANGGGWVFVDFRNNLDDLRTNNIIYGHRRYNQSMFGTLKNVLTSGWQKNTDNHIIKVSTEKYNYLFQVFSIYVTPTDNFYIRTLWATTEDYKNFLNTIVSKSVYNFNTEVNENTKILTLSTCHNTSDKLVVHAKLIKINKKN